MALKSNPVTLGATDTVIYQAPVDAGAVVQPYVANVHATLTRTYQLRLFKQSTGLTTTLGPPSAPLAALAPLAKIPLAVSMEAGDRLIGVASAASSIVVTPFIDISRSSVAKGFNPRGIYAAGTTYAENDVVYLASTGASYISIQDVNVGNSPDVSPAWWMVSAAQGVPGTTGVAGASSLQIVRVMSSGPAGPTADFESGDTIDGVVLATNDLVLRNSTLSPELNGVYVAAASGAASRHSEYDTYDEHPGRVFSVVVGTTYGDTLWQCTSNPGGVLGTNPLTFTTILDAAVAISGDTMTGALTLSGNPTAALHAVPKQYVDGTTPAVKTANYSIVTTDQNAVIRGTGTWTLSHTVAAAGNIGFRYTIKNEGVATITIDPAGSETIDGAANLLCLAKQVFDVVSDGTNWFTVGRQGVVSLSQTIVPSAVAMVDIVLPPDYASFNLVIGGLGFTAATYAAMRFATDGVPNFIAANYYFQITRNTAATTLITASQLAVSHIYITSTSLLGNYGSLVNCEISPGSASSNASWLIASHVLADVSANRFLDQNGGYAGGVGRATHVRVYPPTGNFDAGTFSLTGKTI